MTEPTKEYPFVVKAEQAEESVALNDSNLFKGNIPDSKDSYESGNGEGCWWTFETPKDKEVYEGDKEGTTFMAILCNDSIYYPLVYGTVIQMEVRHAFRPVVDMKWFKEQLATIDVDFNLE